MFHDRAFRQLALAICLLAISTAGSATTPDESESEQLLGTEPECCSGDAQEQLPVTAIWRVQHLRLDFFSPRIHYSCESLKHKIAAILAAIGARRLDVTVRCRGGALMNNALARITLATPIEATPENVAAATTYSPQAQLVARVNGAQLPSANDVARFNAEWRTVALNRQRRLGIDAADCDLLRDLATQVFPKLGVRLEPQRLSCPHSSITRTRPKLRVTALVALPPPPVTYVAEDSTPQPASGLRAAP